MDDDSIGFSAKAPVSAWNKRIGVDYPGVFKALLKAALAAATVNAPGAISAAIDGFFAFKVEDANRPPEELAWLLTRRALARAMAELTVEAARRHDAPLEDKDGLIAALDKALDSTDIWIDPAFFDRPAEHSVVEVIKPPFHEWLASLGLNNAEAESVNHRLGAYFTFALRREWAEHAENYRPIEVEFQKYENRFAKADIRERAWIRNHDYLQRLIRQPVFEQEAFGLKQIYVPLRAWYSEPRKKSQYSEEIGEEGRRVVVDLESCLDAWLAVADRKDAIRVICGGPGSGKTSFAKIWAAKLAEEGHRALFVPLHLVELRDERPNVQAALWEFLRSLRILPNDPLDSSEGESRLLILFDGLDELAMQGRAGQEVARNFVEAVERTLDLVNERRDCLVKVALGGRDVAVEFAGLPDHQVLRVLPYHGAEREDLDDPENLLEADRYACGRWWRQFGEAVGEDYQGVPEPLQDKDLAKITAQPLLNYLLALSYRRGKLDFDRTPNLNLIYADLLDEVYQRRWGLGRHPTKRQLAPREFDVLLQELGLAAWHGAGRTVTETEVELACERAGLQAQLAAFQEGARAGAVSLLAAFYFRQAGKIKGERTFEFTHKSFGEYLIARRLVRAIGDIHDDREINRGNRQRGNTPESALIKWIELTGQRALDSDLQAFFTREVALQDRKLVRQWLMSFAELFNEQLRHRLPMQALKLTNYQEMNRQARNAEQALLSALFACADAANNTTAGLENRTKIAWPDAFALRDLLARLREGLGTDLARHCLSWLEAERQNLVWTDLGEANLVGANLSEAQLAGAHLVGANLSMAVLNGTNLSGANLGGANLGGANLRAAKLRRANVARAQLSEATLTAADFAGANLAAANLTAADLRRAILVKATLEHVNFNGADLEDADLGAADLRRADLTRANLRGVNFGAANLVGIRGLDEGRGLEKVASWNGAKIERRWVVYLGLDPKRLGLDVVDDLDPV